MPKKKQAHTNTGGGKQKSQAATAQPHKDDATCKARRAGTESTTETGELGILARMLPDIPIPHLEIPALPADTPKPESKPPQVFFADDDRMEWVPKYILGNMKTAVIRINIWIKDGHLPKDFERDDLIALARRAPGMTLAWFTPKAIIEAGRNVIVGDGKEKPDRLNIAKNIGASAWEDIEVLVGGVGIRIRKTGMNEWYPTSGWITWAKLKMRPSQATRYFSTFTAIARAKGAIPRQKGRDYISVVNDLNDKFRSAFGLTGQAFKTDGSITKSMFAGISIKK